MSDAETPKQGEPCEECAAPLAADQRYCLHCGRRRGEPRADYRHYMALGSTPAERQPGELPAPTAPSPGEEPATGPQRDYAPLAAVGGIAVLGLMLLVGVLIGRGDGETAAAPAPQVVRVQGGGEEASSASSAKGTSGGLLGGGGARKEKAGGAEGGAPDTGNAVKASESDLEALEANSGESYAKQSEELPNEIATPGAPPPIDKSTPPGGGEGGGEVIK